MIARAFARRMAAAFTLAAAGCAADSLLSDAPKAVTSATMLSGADAAPVVLRCFADFSVVATVASSAHRGTAPLL